MSFQGGRAIYGVIKGVARQPSRVKGKIVGIVNDITKKGVKFAA